MFFFNFEKRILLKQQLITSSVELTENSEILNNHIKHTIHEEKTINF